MADNIVSAPAGVFRGLILKSFSGLPYVGYRGIPFALPPIGKLRFARPVPHPKLEGVYDATQEASVSIQPVGVILGPWKQEEDCLYLNVFTPVKDNSQENAKGETPLKKVMVFIHGGAFFMGCANQQPPGDLVSQGNVIVVTLNYRLSWLGFVKGPTDEINGNMGLWDQLEGLKWVHANIRSFGGDPDDITLAGQSMGGESVSAFSVISQAKNLFTKGILMSGTMFACRSTFGSSDVLLDWLVNKTSLSCEGKTHSQLIQELKDLPQERFVLPVQNEITNKFTTIDKELFPASFPEMIADKDYLNKVGFFDRDYLVTLTNNEGQLAQTGLFSCFGDGNEGISMAERLNQSEELLQKLIKWYSQEGHHCINPVNDMFSDPIICLPTFDFLKVATDSPNKQHNSYFLLFDHYPTYAPDRADAAGTVHCIDLCYLFDIQPNEMYQMINGLSTKKEFTEEDKKMKKICIDLVVDFMHNGNCKKSSKTHVGNEWQPFEPNKEFYLKLTPQPTIGQFPYMERRKLWETVVPEWKKEEMSKENKS